MNFYSLVHQAIERGATDIHLENGQPVVFRVQGSLLRTEQRPDEQSIETILEEILDEKNFETLESRGSADLTTIVSGVNCRINVMKSDRGFGLVVRLLRSEISNLENSNLHPDLAEFLKRDSGLILLAGPTGSGKSTTLAALLEEINQRSARHIITLESPIEYRLQPAKSFIRQREVGEHTPSFEQGLMDSLREDPDVIVVGEMRDAETMRWTLNAAETGHLVLATLHASNPSDVVHRMMMAFPPERQNSVLAQLADSLIAIICQKMTHRPEQKLMVPVLEILPGNFAAKNAIRKGEAAKLISILQTSAQEGAWTFERYQNWLDSRKTWFKPPIPKVSHEMQFVSRPKVRKRKSSQSLFSDDVSALSHAPESREKKEPFRPPTKPGSPEVYDFSTAVTNAPRRVLSNEPAKHISHAAELAISIEESFGAKPKGSKLRSTKIHHDGRIEIPDLEVDLEELARSIKIKEDYEG